MAVEITTSVSVRIALAGAVLTVTDSDDAQAIVDALAEAFNLDTYEGDVVSSFDDTPSQAAGAAASSDTANLILDADDVMPGDRVRILASNKPENVGRVLEVVADNLPNSVVTLRKPSGKRIGFDANDLAAGKLAFAD